MSTPDRRARLDRDHENLSVRRQCQLLGLARSGVYRQRRPANDNDLGVVRWTSCSRSGRSWGRVGWPGCCATKVMRSIASGCSG